METDNWVNEYIEQIAEHWGKELGNAWVQQLKGGLGNWLNCAVVARLQPVPLELPREIMGLSQFYPDDVEFKEAYKVRCPVGPCRGFVGYVLVSEDLQELTTSGHRIGCILLPPRGWVSALVQIDKERWIHLDRILRKSSRMKHQHNRGYPTTSRRPGGEQFDYPDEITGGVHYDPWGPRPGSVSMESEDYCLDDFPVFVECSDCGRALKVTRPLGVE